MKVLIHPLHEYFTHFGDELLAKKQLNKYLFFVYSAKRGISDRTARQKDMLRPLRASCCLESPVIGLSKEKAERG